MRIFALALAAVLMLASPAAAKPQDKYAHNGAVKIHYVVDGTGPLVVMIHGFPDYWATWKPLMAELSKAGYRAVALDTRGYNLSDKPEGVAITSNGRTYVVTDNDGVEDWSGETWYLDLGSFQQLFR